MNETFGQAARLALGAALSAAPCLAQPDDVVAASAAAPAMAAATAHRVPGGDQVADSLYRSARAALDRRDYRRAATMFMQVRARDPRAPIAADALYWHAWAMYRIGGTPSLRTALESLTLLSSDHPRASIAGDARELRLRVCGALAQGGDAECASEVSTAASRGVVEAPDPTASPTTGSARTQAQEQSCPAEEDDERVMALNALLQMNSEQALPILEKVLARRDRCSATLRRKAVFMVSQKREPRAADMLVTAARTDPDSEVRQQAIFWLGQTGTDRAVDLLQEILQRETSEDVLKRAVFAMSQHRSPRAQGILRELAQRANAPLEIRSEAIFWLGQRKGDGENLTLLTGLYSRVTEQELKEKIIFSVSQIRSADVAKFLTDIAMNERERIDLRKNALFWMGQNRSVAMDALAALYGRTTDREFNEQLIFVYSQRRDGVDKLLDIARNEKDRELRGKAIFWLSQSRDPRVVRFLEELISK